MLQSRPRFRVFQAGDGHLGQFLTVSEWPTLQAPVALGRHYFVLELNKARDTGIYAAITRGVGQEPTMVYLKILAGIALIVSILWALAKPGYDSGLAVVVSLSALLSLFLAGNKKHGVPRQQQVVSKSSLGVQAGGNVKIGTISRDKHAE